MSGTPGRERRAFVGPASGTSLAAVQVLPAALNSDRISVVWPGFYDYDATGTLTLYPPYMLAALVGAMAAGVSPGTPLTNKSAAIRGLETAAKNPADTDALIMSGVLALEPTPTGYRVARSVSTWLTNNNYNRVEVSCGAATDYVSRSVRDALQVLVGTKASARMLGRAAVIAETTLRSLAEPEPLGPEVIVGDANSPAWRNIRATLVGDAIKVEFECSPVIPVNFVPVAISIVPYSGTASA
jgi:hypothetical protein